MAFSITKTTLASLCAVTMMSGCSSISQPNDLPNDGYGPSTREAVPPQQEGASNRTFLGSLFSSESKATTSAPQNTTPRQERSSNRDDSGFLRVNDSDYQEAINNFKKAADSKPFFDSAFGYAVFPMIGKAGFVVGGAYGQGRVYRRGAYVGNTEMIQASIGFQLGGQAFSQIIFFQDQRAFDEFTSGNFEFGAQASAAIITLGAGAEASTKGMSTTGNLSDKVMWTDGYYYKGMAVFSLVTAGLMYEASLAGQKFSYQKGR